MHIPNRGSKILEAVYSSCRHIQITGPRLKRMTDLGYNLLGLFFVKSIKTVLEIRERDIVFFSRQQDVRKSMSLVAPQL